jgi:uncharacterized protein (TIGR02246 family)
VKETELNDWLGKYGRAWENQDPDAAAGLFAEDGTYAWGPFNDPIRGREAIHAAWQHATQGQQEDIRFGYEILAVTGARGIARWWASMKVKSTGQTVRMEGIFLLTLTAAGLCKEFREWWNEDPPATDAAEYQ